MLILQILLFSMNKITQKPELNIQYKTLNKAETDSFRHEMIMKTSQYLNNEITSSKKDSNILSDNSQEKSLFIKKTALERTISVYQWRFKTCYPVVKPIKIIVKAFTGKLNEKKALCKKNSQSPFQIWNLDQNIFQIVVITQKFSHRLSQLGSLPLPQLFYLLKQILVGFECLIDIFGLFQPTEQMVIVNQQNQWKFWISEDFASNSKRQSNITQAQFILKIIKMVQSRLPNSKVGMKFFDDLKNLPVRSLTFLNLLDMTNIFISFNKIMVAKKFVSSPIKSLNSLCGSKNSNFFGINRTFTQFKETPKSNNDKSFSHFQTIAQFQQVNSPKQNNGLNKLNTMKSMNEKTFNKKQFQHFGLNRQNQSKKQIKSHLKISQMYCAQALSKNNIQKRASFLFNSKDIIKERPEQNFVVSQLAQESYSPRNAATVKIQNEMKIQTEKKNRPFSPIFRQRKFSFECQNSNNGKNSKPLKNNESLMVKQQKKQRKNSYYEVQKPNNKQAFSQSPSKTHKTTFLNETQKQIAKGPARNQNNLIHRQNANRGRKYSEHAPKIKSLDQFAKKNKKMCQSSVLEGHEQNKQIKYGNLKYKDISCHNRNATISGLAFGQLPPRKENVGFNNIDNDLYNGKFEQIMKSMKSKSNQGKQDKEKQQDEDFNAQSYRSKRRATAFQMIRECREILDAEEEQDDNSKPIIRVSNANNQTAQTLNKSELQLAKGSQQSNSISNKNVRQSDSSNQKSPYLFANRKGMIGESNLSVFSCKTYQPGKQGIQKNRKEQGSRHMATSQDCFNKNQSDSSQQFLKSNNWNKKISGLFSDVASIKVLKQSNHFGEESDFFEKDYLKDVKLEKLDKFGKQLKCSIIETDEGHHILNLPTRGRHNKSFSLIGQVKQEPYENDPSYLQYSTSMICQSKHQQERYNKLIEIPEVQRHIQNCQSFEQEGQQNQQIAGGFLFSTELYRVNNNIL